MREKQSDLLSDEAVLERIFKQLDDIFQKANYDWKEVRSTRGKFGNCYWRFI